jgi:hypothetical protein
VGFEFLPCQLRQSFSEGLQTGLELVNGFKARSSSQRCAASGQSEIEPRAAVERVPGAQSIDSCALRGRQAPSSRCAAHRSMRTRGPGEAALLLMDVASMLRSESIDYAVIGAMAASVYGLVRASVDADAILFISAAELGALERKFKSADLQTELRRGDPDDPIAALLELTDGYGNRVDLLVGLRGLERAALSRTIDVPFVGEVLRVIGREDFIAMKVFAGAPRDIIDAGSAIAAAGDSLDLLLLRRLATRFGRTTVKALEDLLASLPAG